MKYYAEKLQDELEKLPALKKVEIHGIPDPQVRVELDLEKMSQMHLPLSAVTGSLQSEIANIPGGSISAGQRSFNIKTSGNFQSIDEIKNTIVSSSSGKNIYLKDVAKIYYGFEDTKYKTRLNGHRCIFITAAQKEGENISKTKQSYEPVLAQFKKTLPSNIDLVQNFDQADNVNRRLGSLGEDFLIAILLGGHHPASPRFSVSHDRYDLHSALPIHRTGFAESFRNQPEPAQHCRTGRGPGIAGRRQHRGGGKH